MLPVHVTVAAVIENPEHAGQFLMVEEISSAGKTVYNQPAGHLESDESIEQAVIREVYEETGVNFKPDALIGIYNLNPASNGRHYLRFCFRGSVVGKPVLQPHDSDIIAAHWMDVAHISSLRAQHRSGIITQCLADYIAGNSTPLDVLQCSNNEELMQQNGLKALAKK